LAAVERHADHITNVSNKLMLSNLIATLITVVETNCSLVLTAGAIGLGEKPSPSPKLSAADADQLSQLTSTRLLFRALPLLGLAIATYLAAFMTCAVAKIAICARGEAKLRISPALAGIVVAVALTAALFS
jgi:hypothetical protein